MKRQFLHLCAYSCDKCRGPVVSASLGVRENEISKESQIRQIGAICLECGHRQSQATERLRARYLPPIEWGPAGAIKHGVPQNAFRGTGQIRPKKVCQGGGGPPTPGVYPP